MRTPWLLLLTILCAGAWAASCPYCGQTYGEGPASDSAYIAGIRAQHEATCASRPRPQPPPQPQPQPVRPAPRPRPAPQPVVRGPSPTELGRQASWYASENAENWNEIYKWNAKAGAYRYDLSYYTRRADWYERFVKEVGAETQRLGREWPRLQAAHVRIGSLAEDRARAVNAEWRAYLDELQKLHQAGTLPAPLEKTTVPIVQAYDSEEAAQRIGHRRTRRTKPPPAREPVLDHYPRNATATETELRRHMYPINAPRAEPAVAAMAVPVYPTATQAQVDRFKASWEESKRKRAAAWAAMDAIYQQVKAESERGNRYHDQHGDVSERSREANRLVNYYADRLALSAKDWVVEEVKGAVTRHASEQLRTAAPALAERAEAAREVVEDLTERYAPTLEALEKIKAHAGTMREQIRQWDGFFGEIRTVIASHFDPAHCDALAAKLEGNHRELFRQTIQNAGGSEEVAKALDFLVNYDLRQVFRKP